MWMWVTKNEEYMESQVRGAGPGVLGDYWMMERKTKRQTVEVCR